MNDPKSVVGRYYDVVNGGALERLDEVCTPDMRGHAGAGADLAELKQSFGAFLEAFPDLKTVPRHLIREGDLVSAWVTYEGTHEGEFAGIPGTGRHIKVAGWDLMRVEGDRIVEITQYCDLFTLMNQIGALPTTTPA
jgi:steroid delta-isomerase-like uncharacterized protein